MSCAKGGVGSKPDLTNGLVFLTLEDGVRKKDKGEVEA